MDVLDLARWQFAITTVYHFLFVPITIGMSALVAGLQTAWVRTGREQYLRATKFWGKLFLINFAMGVVTGIVQEFQFGMNWSDYSRFVGDVFGAPLAIEGLLAFSLESTFLGLWIFGRDRLPEKLHLATIWLASIGTLLSAYFILAANSWMQHPVGYTMNPVSGRAELTSIGAVLTNSTTLVAFPHTITASFLTAGAVLLAVSSWHLKRRHQEDVFRPGLRLGAWVVLVAGGGRGGASGRADGFVAALADGFATVLGDDGAGLSAGQRQRLALARAFLRDAPIVLLDEPTANLDTDTAGEVTAVIRELARGRTVIMAAHRPELIALADRVVDLCPQPAGGR